MAEKPNIRAMDDPPPPLAVTATNEYGEYDRAALALYGLEMVVEPYRETTLAANGSVSSANSIFCWRVEEVDDSGVPLDSVDPVLVVASGDEVTVTLTKPGSMYLLSVGQHSRNGTLLSRAAVRMSCKYVRREIRTLNDADREEFLDAMETYYTMSTEEGMSKFGETFFNYQKITALHSLPRTNFCYRGGLQFLTAYAAFDLMMERSLQAVNPRVSLPFWDYMIDATTLGTEWADSVIFDDGMFGRAVGSTANGYQVTGSRFGNISTIDDPGNTLVDSKIPPLHNAYGLIGAEHNYQDLPRLTRTSSFCNLKAHAKFASPDVLFSCFENHRTLAGWETCMEEKVYGDMQGLLGGAFNCSVDMHQFHEEHDEYSAGLLTFVLKFLTSSKWPENGFMSEYNDCDTECTRGQTEPCGCTCKVDAFTLSEDEVYSLASGLMEELSGQFAGEDFVSYDEFSNRPWGFMQDGTRLDDDSTMLLLRHVVKLGCEPAAVGAMSTGASPMDPLFWMLHPLFEKALHVVWLSPQYRDKYEFEWKNGTCNGSKLDDALPFTERLLGTGTRSNFLSNSEIMSMLHPSNPRLPYVYENFADWGAKDEWNYCPECTLSAAGS